MNLEQLASIGEMVGGIAVVFTLMYLAYETRRNTTMHVASTTSEAYINWTNINDFISGDVELAKLWVRVYDNQSLSDFNELERLRINLSIRSVIQRLAAVHQQHQNSLIDDEFWQIHKIFFAGFFQVKGIAEWWEIEKQSSLFTESFIRELEQTKGFTLGPAGQRLVEESS
jgi:hypothetical protein